MAPEDLKKKVDDLLRRTEAVNKKKANLQGQLQAKKEELAALITEIRAAGYDPKTLAAEETRVRQELETLVANYETDLAAVETALSAYDKK